MKKIIVGFMILAMLFVVIANCPVLAENTTTGALETEKTNDILEKKGELSAKIEEYNERYHSESYGLVAFVLDMVRLYSIPVCFAGIVIGALKQYVLGTRRLDMKHKGYGMIMTFVTLLVVCQVLPLIFTLVVIGWRG